MRVLSIHTQHDANLCIAVDGEVALVLELERLFGERYFESSLDPATFTEQWRRALDEARACSGVERFDVVVTSWVMPSQRKLLAELVAADRWLTVDHHRAHAAAGHFDSSLPRSLVFSYDGGGNDGAFNVYRADGPRLDQIDRLHLNLGLPYRLLGTTMPEITERRAQPRAGHPSLAGKLMAYAALGNVREDWRSALREYYRWFLYPLQALYTLGEAVGLPLETDALDPTSARDLAATSQAVFEELLLQVVRRHVAEADVDGVVLTGGCALNVAANEKVRREVGLPVHVPPAPNDCGIAVGAAWCVEPPSKPGWVYVGRPVDGGVTLRNQVEAWGGRKTDMGDVAARLARGDVVGVVRGRAELGPRALGHRSILCYPDREGLQQRLNRRVKRRAWYRPYGPVIPEEETRGFFPEDVRSPYMSFAPRLRPEAAEQFPAIAHLDGTARVQTVAAHQEPWLHALLLDVGRRKGAPILLNTSFNAAGEPMIQDVDSALALLDATDIDAVLIEDYVFEKQPTGAGRTD